jgi:hypothetical protein
LAGLNQFIIGKSQDEDKKHYSKFYLDMGDEKQIPNKNLAVVEVVENIRQYRVMFIDTKGKEHPIFLIIGDFHG